MFWQPKIDYLKLILSKKSTTYLLAVTNYLIWIFLFYISYLLIKKNINVFWQIFFATAISEIVERVLKSKVYWRRPLFNKNDRTPPGLVDKWYQTGSFPSGHTIKAVYFFLFVLQYQIFPPETFLAICIPLLLFRIFIGFHYPIDMIGGAAIGGIMWLVSNWIIFPQYLNNFIKIIFNFVFFIK